MSLISSLRQPSTWTVFWLMAQRPWAFVVLTLVNVAAGLADLLGISLIIPLFDVLRSGTEVTGVTSDFVVFFDRLGVDLTLNVVLLTMIVLALIKFALVYTTEVQKAALVADIREQFRLRLMSHMVSAAYRYLSGQEQARFQNLLTTEVDLLSQALKSLAAGIMSWALVLIFIGASLTVNWQMTVMICLFMGVLVVSMRFLAVRMSRLSHRLSMQNSECQTLIHALLNAVKYLKASGETDRPLGRLNTALRKRVYISVRLAMVRGFGASAIEPMAVLIACMFAFMSIQWLGQSVSQVLLPLLFLYRTGGRIGGIQRSVNGYYQGVGSVVAVRAVLEELEAVEERRGNGTSPAPLANAIILDGVGYDVEGKALLKDVVLTIPQGAVVGFVGETGAGKTTLVDVVNGLLRPTAGKISWDGVSYSDFDLAELRRHFGYLGQDPAIFTGSARDNITLWAEDADDDGIWRAAVAARADDFIRRSLGGLDGNVGDHGKKLSGGQRQRLALARELYRDAEILIVDEGTSALDAETEQMVKESLMALRGRKTILMVAHRLHTLRQCDLLVILKNGEIEFQGNWDTALARNAWLRRAMELQAVQDDEACRQ